MTSRPSTHARFPVGRSRVRANERPSSVVVEVGASSTDGWMDGLMDGWNRWMDGSMDGWRDRQSTLPKPRQGRFPGRSRTTRRLTHARSCLLFIMLLHLELRWSRTLPLPAPPTFRVSLSFSCVLLTLSLYPHRLPLHCPRSPSRCLIFLFLAVPFCSSHYSPLLSRKQLYIGLVQIYRFVCP